jgi:hypothetical protein
MHCPLHIGETIKQQLMLQERSIAWLAKKICCDPSVLCKHLKCPHIHTELLWRISIALEVDLFACYSRHLAKNEVSIQPQATQQ